MPQTRSIGFGRKGSLDLAIDRLPLASVHTPALGNDVLSYIQTYGGSASAGGTFAGNVHGTADNTFFSWDKAVDRVGFSKAAGQYGDLAYAGGAVLQLVQYLGQTTINPLGGGTRTLRAQWDATGNLEQYGNFRVDGTTYLASTVTIAAATTITGLLTLSSLAGAVVDTPNLLSTIYGTVGQIATSTFGGINSAGTLAVLARADHAHALTTPVTAVTTGAGLTPLTNATGPVTIANTGALSVTASGAGIGATPTTGAVVITNTGVTSATSGGTGLTVAPGTGAIVITNTGVTSIVLGATTANLTVSQATGQVALSMSPTPAFTSLTTTALSTMGPLNVKGKLDIQLANGTSVFTFDPVVAQFTLPPGSLSGAALIDATVSFAKLTGTAVAQVVAFTTQDTAFGFLRRVTATGSTLDANGKETDGFTLANAATRVADPASYAGYALTNTGMTTTAVAAIGGPGYTGLAPGQYQATAYFRVSSVVSTAQNFTVQMVGTGLTGNPVVAGIPANLATSYVGIPLVFTVPAANTSVSLAVVNSVLPATLTWYFSHLSAINFQGKVTPESSSYFFANAAITSAQIQSLTASSITVGIINVDDIAMGAAGRLYAGASKTAPSRLEFVGGGTDASRGIFGYASSIQTIRLSADGIFQLRTATTGTRVNIDASLGIELYSGATRTLFADVATGNLTLTGNITATGGLFTGDVQITTGSLYAGAQVASGQRMRLTSTGIVAFDSAGTQRLNIGNDGSMWLGSATTFAVTALGAMTATSGVIGGFNINATSLFSGATQGAVNSVELSTTGYIVAFGAAGAWAGLDGRSTNNMFRIFNGTSDTFYADRSGNVTMTGTVTAGAGAIGGWSITTSQIAAGRMTIHSSPYLYLTGNGSSYVLLDGRATNNLLTINGSTGVTAMTVDINGNTVIGGFTISASEIYSGAPGAANSVRLNNSGFIQANGSAANGGIANVVLDGRSGQPYMLYISNGASNTFTVDKVGNVALTGTLTGSLFRTATSGARVVVGPGSGFTNDVVGFWSTADPNATGQIYATFIAGATNTFNILGPLNNLSNERISLHSDGYISFFVSNTAGTGGEVFRVDSTGIMVNSTPIFMRTIGDTNHVLFWQTANDGVVLRGRNMLQLEYAVMPTSGTGSAPYGVRIGLAGGTTARLVQTGSAGNLHLDSNVGSIYANWYAGANFHCGNGAQANGTYFGVATINASSISIKTDVESMTVAPMAVKPVPAPTKADTTVIPAGAGSKGYGLAAVKQLRPVRFRYQGDNAVAQQDDRQHLGFIAEELALVFPEVVYDMPQISGPTIKGINYAQLIPILYTAIVELSAAVDALKPKVI